MSSSQLGGELTGLSPLIEQAVEMDGADERLRLSDEYFDFCRQQSLEDLGILVTKEDSSTKPLKIIDKKKYDKYK